jgi:glycosyltransferase involved in cell wall biosynthesis
MKRPPRPSPLKVGFVLLSNSQRPLPSTRIAALNMFPFLRQAHFEPSVLFEPEQAMETPDVSGLERQAREEGFGIVVFQKVHGPSVAKLAHQLSAAGVKTVYSVCDLVDPEMAAATHVTLAVTDYLKSLYPPAYQSKIRVVHDGIEHPDRHKTSWGTHRGSRRDPLHAVLVTSDNLGSLPVLCTPPAWLRVTIVGRYPPEGRRLHRLRNARWQFAGRRTWGERLNYLRFMASRRIRCLPWDPEGVYDHMRGSDLGIIPVEPGLDPEGWNLKSENRLTMKMCVGLPVIATPIPSYEAVVHHGRNGFLPRTPADWLTCLEALRDPSRRRDMGERARETVIRTYSKDEQARLLIEVLKNLPG